MLIEINLGEKYAMFTCDAYRKLPASGINCFELMQTMMFVQRQRTSGRRPRADDDAASETSSVCSEASFRTGSDISDVCMCFHHIMDIVAIFKVLGSFPISDKNQHDAISSAVILPKL